MNSARKIKRHKNPRENANFFSAATFFYTLPTFIKGRKKPLEENDLYRTLDDHQSDKLANKMEILWNNEVDQAKRKNRKPSLVRVFFQMFGFEYAILSLMFSCLLLIIRPAQAILLGRLLLYYTKSTVEIAQKDAQLYAAGIVFTSFAYVLIFHPLMVQLHLVGLKLKIACCSLIYRKALRLNHAAFNKTSLGQIVNLISTDTAVFIPLAFTSNYLWISPMDCIIIPSLMYREVGVSSIVGVLLLLLLIPIHQLLGKAASNYRLKAAKCTDERVGYVSEILVGIKDVKMYGWENLIQSALSALRNLEMKFVRWSMYIQGVNNSFDVLLIPIVFYVTIVVYVLQNEIRADKVFTLTIFYNSLRATMARVFPLAINYRAIGLVSVQRIEEFLCHTETKLTNFDGVNDQVAVKITDGHAKWHEMLTLKNVNLTINPGDLVAIIGPVGCGKSSLINVILRELPLLSGKLQINGQISYASQEAWLFGGTVRDNILFGENLDVARYDEVVRVCALRGDFDLLPFADQTIVGGRGTSLSGGQMARISLARAVYRDVDIYLLDEPFAAVDARVGKQIFTECVKVFLNGKTVILATHQLKYLKEVDEVVVLKDGAIVSQGPWTDDEDVKHTKKNDDIDETTENPSDHSNLKNTKINKNEEMVKEQQSEGSVSINVYTKYLTAGGYLKFFYTMLLFLLSQVLLSGGAYFLTYWVNREQIESAHEEHADNSKNMFIYIYSAIVAASIVVTCARSFTFFSQLLTSSYKLHNNMAKKVIGATMHFFNTNPQGRIINRFSQDMAAVDTTLPPVAADVIHTLVAAIATIILITIVNYWLIIPAVIIITVSYYLASICLLTTRDVKRIEGVTRSPIFEHLSASIQGLGTVRAFQVETILKEEFDAYQDLHSCCFHLYITTSHGFGYYLDCLCVIYTSIVTLSFVVFDYENLSGNVGLAITQSLGLLGFLQWAVQQTVQIENNMTSVERILEYDSIEQEDRSGIEAPQDWPKSGEIIFRNLSLKYSPDGPLTLKNLNFKILPKEKIGIVGRTGAGKSSIVNALLRLSYTSGDILIDGVDIKTISLQTLRKKVSVIPQNPTLFSGSLRQSLDPFNKYKDEDLWSVLEEVELKDFFTALPQGLYHVIDYGGANISVGQRQLLCLARAILGNTKVLILDEATANIDLETDKFIQRTIRKKFDNCTVITIAHRLETVIDSDKVMVVRQGEVVEFDEPSVLLANTNGYFYNIAQQLRNINLNNNNNNTIQ